MRNGIEGAGRDHPLASEQSMQGLIARLPADARQALDELGSWLEALQDLTELKLLRKFEIVDLTDCTAREYLEHLAGEYLQLGADTGLSGDSPLSPVADTFSRQLARSYQDLVGQFQTYGAGWGEIRDKIPLVVGRAMRATALRLKWQYMRYAPVEKDLWHMLFQLWAFAEDRGFGGARIEVYRGEESTLQREFLKPLMLAVSAADSLPPERVEVADRIIARLAHRYDIQRHPAKDCHFFVDVDSHAPPARYLAAGRVRPGVRFFGPGDSVSELDRLSAAIASEGILHTKYGLGDATDIELVIDVLGHLSRHWTARRTSRKDERRRSASSIGVVRGFDAIVSKLSDHGVLDLTLDDVIESWTIENESEGGYGAILSEDESESVRVGAILGIRAADSRVWAVGIVRRVAARNDNQRYVGIQVLARAARLVSLRDTEGSGGTHTAVLLPSNVGDSVGQGEVSILLQARVFSSHANVEMQVYQHAYLLEPRMLLESGNDFELAYFRIVQRTE